MIKRMKLSVLFLMIISLLTISFTVPAVHAASTNIALNKTVITDSAQSGNPAANAVDGSTTTRWCAANNYANHWLAVDLGGSASITGAEVMWEKSGVVYKYKVEVSTDNSTWTTKVDKTGNTSTAQTQTDNFTATARYVRITVTGLPNTSTWASIFEFRVLGTVTTTAKPTVYLAGDSTVQTYTVSQAPQQGWGQRIPEFFTTDVIFVNKAIGGRSSKSFIDEGRLTEILNVIQPNDYLFCQWGINDRYKSDPTRYTEPYTTFKEYLKQYITGARSKNAIPVLITPTPRFDYVNGVFQNDFPDYCTAMKQVAAETNTKIIDLQTDALSYLNSIGYNAALALYMPNDVLHFNDKGAYQMARLVSQGVKGINMPISQYVK